MEKCSFRFGRWVTLVVVLALLAPAYSVAADDPFAIFKQLQHYDQETDRLQERCIRDLGKGKVDKNDPACLLMDRTNGHMELVTRLEEIAKSGDPRATYLLGMSTYLWASEHDRESNEKWERDLVRKQYEEAFAQFTSAARQGVTAAAYQIATMHEHGEGAIHGKSVAVEWYARAGKSYLRDGDREMALKCYDKIEELIPGHTMGVELHRLLYPPSKTKKGQ
jgi:hypothetical protein